MTRNEPGPTVYYDGSCPLCRAEIGHYRSLEGAEAFCFRDVSQPDCEPAGDLTRRDAMRRFHVRAADGRLLSGAEAFAEVWRHLPRWRWAARVAALPGVLRVLEAGYRLFLPVRPYISRVLAHVAALRKRS